MYGFACGLLGFVSLTTLSLMSIEKYIDIKSSAFRSYLSRKKFKISMEFKSFTIFYIFFIKLLFGPKLTV